jgi:hypothetical protein
MTHAERDWRDGRPGDAALDESTGPSGRMHGDDSLAEDVHGDPMAERVHEDDPLAERVHEDDPLAERVHEDDPLVQDVHDGPLAEPVPGGDPLAVPAPRAAGSVNGGASAREEPHAQPAGAGEHERFVARWLEIQAGFVDEPGRAVQDADALVVDLMDQLARRLASERERLQPREGTGDLSTEDLRQGLRRYRALFERLLAV